MITNKFTLSNQGFQQLQAQLYALSNQELNEQAILVKYDFTEWVKAHFELDSTQESFLDALPSKAISYLAENASFALANRLEIVLEKEDKPIGVAGNKLIRPKPETSVTASASGEFEAEGRLVIEITY